MESNSEGGGFARILAEAVRRQREKAGATGEPALLPRYMNSLVEHIQKVMKNRNESFPKAFKEVFSDRQRWAKEGVSENQLPRYQEFAEDIFNDKADRLDVATMPAKQDDFFPSQTEEK